MSGLPLEVARIHPVNLIDNSDAAVIRFKLVPFCLRAPDQEIAPAIENVYKFSVFCNPLTLNSLWGGHFFELADNGLLSCRLVVGFNSRKWGHSGVLGKRPGASLVGWWDRSQISVSES